MDRYFFSFSYRVSVEDNLRAEGRTKHCFVKEGRLTSIPKKVRELFDV
jgi:acyl-CoA thioester hydrolase